MKGFAYSFILQPHYHANSHYSLLACNEQIYNLDICLPYYLHYSCNLIEMKRLTLALFLLLGNFTPVLNGLQHRFFHYFNIFLFSTLIILQYQIQENKSPKMFKLYMRSRATENHMLQKREYFERIQGGQGGEFFHHLLEYVRALIIWRIRIFM